MSATISKGITLLGRYEIQNFLGRGGFGETYLAIDKLKMDSLCVIKRLKPKHTDADTLVAARKLFKREAQFLYELGNHKQIPHLLADFEENGEFYLAQEFIAGEDFKKELEKVQKLNEAQVISLLIDVLNVLNFVHEHHVVHRDIKPSNLIRCPKDGKFVLIDFGSVKQTTTQETSSNSLTSSTIAVGTKGYMPNEQHAGKPRSSSDIYALGMTAIHALIGKPPTELDEDKRSGEIIWRKHANVSNKLAAILDKMIKSHHVDRYPEADDVLKDLRNLQSPWKSQVSSFSSTFATKKLPSMQFSKIKYALISLVVVGTVFATFKISPFISQISQANPSGNVANNSNNPDDLLQKAEELFQVEKYQEAIVLYDKALKNNPNNAHEIWRIRAIALYKLDKYPESLSSLDKALAIKSDDLQTLNNKADLLIHLERLDEAIAIANKVLATEAKNTYALNNRGLALAKQKKNEEALKDFEKSIELEPNNYRAWLYKANTLHYNLQKYNQAVDAYDKATKIQPEYSETWYEKGKALVSLKRYQEALYSFDEAIRIEPKYVEALVGKSIALYRLNRYEETIKFLDEALKYKPDNTFAWFGKGQALFNLKKYQDAIVAYDKAIEIKADYQDAITARKQAKEKLKDVGK